MSARLGVGSQARRMMTMRVRVLRPIAVGRDRYGHDIDDRFQVVHDALPCHVWVGDDRDVKDAEKRVVLGALNAVAPADADIGEADLLESVRDRAGRVLFDGPAEVLSVTYKGGHKRIVARPVA